jgi:glycosyltransferase involved in cell wall biosynthesis
MISVIIPAKNEARSIGRCIQSLFASACQNVTMEVIVVDNGSMDDTVKIAEELGAKVFVRKDLHISGLRNYGVAHASFNIIAFIDADCEAVPGWIDNAVSTLTKDSTIGIVGDYYQLPGMPGWIESAYFSSLPRRIREVNFLSGGNMVMSKETFLKVGGFDERNITAEDYVLCLKVRSEGYRILADPNVAVVHHGNSKTLYRYFKREMWCGLGMLDIFKYGKITMPLLWAIANIILLVGILAFVYFELYNLAFIFCLALFILPLCAAYVHSRFTQWSRFIIPLYLIFTVYGVAHTLSLILTFPKFILQTRLN